MISIITPTRRRPLEIVRRACQSVDAQTFTDWRHIVCSDGQYEDAVRRLASDPRRSYSFLPQQAGHFGAGVRAAMLPKVDTEFVAWLDDDNAIFPRYLEVMLRALHDAPHAGFAICPALHFGPLPDHSGPPPWVLPGVPPAAGSIDTIQVVARADAMKSVGWTLAGYQSDGVTYAKLAAAFPYVTVPEVLAVHL